MWRPRPANSCLDAADDGAGTAFCPHCGGRALIRFGRTPQGAQRWHCRGCGRKHQTVTSTALAGLHQPAKFASLVEDMLGPQPSSCRRLARRLALDKSTVWKWRQKASGAFAATIRPQLIQPMVQRAQVVRESRKASREWVNHERDPAAHPAPDRLRWADYRRRGLVPPHDLPRYRIPVDIAVAIGGRRSAVIGTEHPKLAGAQLCDPSLMPDVGEVASPPVEPGTVAAGLSGSLALAVTAFRDFLAPFRGPATRHLSGYVAWYVARTDAAFAPAPPGKRRDCAYSAASAMGLLGWLVQLA
jgi:transposase-like protein